MRQPGMFKLLDRFLALGERRSGRPPRSRAGPGTGRHAPEPPGETGLREAGQGFVRRRQLDADRSAGGGLIANAAGELVPHYWGHRKRLRARFLEGGQEPMPDYELLELLLFQAIPRIDVKPLAKRLLKRFGDLHGVFAATEQEILKVEGTNPWVHYHLRLADAFARRLARAQMLDRPVLTDRDAVERYLHTLLSGEEKEHFRVLFLDRKNRLIADELMGSGTVGHTPVYPREIVKRALELSASALILVHNHPSGDPSPSTHDILMTEKIDMACSTVDVAVHDHLIVGRSGIASMRELGLADF